MLIEQSIAKQYGVLPSQQEEMKYSDWAKLLSGIMHDTPLGQVVSIRRETDQKIIKTYNADQMKIRHDWQKFCAKNRPPTPEEEKRMYARLENTLNSLFGKGKGG